MKGVFDANADKQAFVIDDAFINLKMKQIIALEDLDETNNASDFSEAVELVELNGSGWVYDRIGSMSIGLDKHVTKGGNSYVELPINYLSVPNIENEKDNVCGVWCIKAHINPTKVNPCRTKRFEDFFNPILTTVIILNNVIIVKDILELEKFVT